MHVILICHAILPPYSILKTVWKVMNFGKMLKRLVLILFHVYVIAFMSKVLEWDRNKINIKELKWIHGHFILDTNLRNSEKPANQRCHHTNLV